MNKEFKKLMLTAAVTGLIGGATARLQAAPVAAVSSGTITTTSSTSGPWLLLSSGMMVPLFS